MAVNGLHTLLYTPQADELRACLRDVFGWDNVDAGGGWLIFKTPPAEMGVHPGETTGHQVSMMCDDIEATMAELAAKGIEFDGDPTDQGFGIVVPMVLPGGVRIDLYEPRHEVAYDL